MDFTSLYTNNICSTFDVCSPDLSHVQLKLHICESLLKTRSLFTKQYTAVDFDVNGNQIIAPTSQISMLKLNNSQSDLVIYSPKEEAEVRLLGDPNLQCDSLLSDSSREFRNQLGSEDSSYDSDCDLDNSVSQTISATEHEDVSRQVSDTLGAEFSEYVTIGCSDVTDKLKSCGVNLASDKPSKDSEITPTSNATYSAKVEFGLKLGYPEHLIQTALLKLGGEPTQNELLEELIKLGASTKIGEIHEGNETSALFEHITSFKKHEDNLAELHHIVIDGSNVAMSHGNKEVFSCKGIKICVDWFKSRGHKEITVFVPKWRKESTKPDSPISDQEILLELEKERLLVFTPSRLVNGRRLVCYDDRYILKLAAETGGIVVSNDNYRDLAQENNEFRKIVEDRILMYSFVNDRFMPPDDPLGRNGPTLDNFLCKKIRSSDLPAICPYAKKCTYGNKCKYYHPERGNLPQKSITERLQEHAQKQILEVKTRGKGEVYRCKSLGIANEVDTRRYKKLPLSRTKSSIPSLNLNENINSKNFNRASKSRSVENVSKDCKLSICSKPVGNLNFTKVECRNQVNHPSFHGPPHEVPNNVEPVNPDINTHAKLQRQLTLNPCYDPRINQIRMQYSSQLNTDNPPRPHLSLSTCMSSDYQGYEVAHWSNHSSLHSNLTRISSAPDSYFGSPNLSNAYQQREMQRLSSTSDSQLNIFNGTVESLNDPFDCDYPGAEYSAASLHWGNISYPVNNIPIREDSRSKLYYHLSSLFPSDQVKAAMSMYPDETNPQKICAVILGMFPK